MPRFSLLRHDHPTEHWDFFLECGDALRSWRLASRPALGEDIAAEPRPDHRKAYLDYEGPVSNGRGRVVQEDAGEFDWKEVSITAVTVSLRGQWLTGDVCLRQTSAGWRFSWTAHGLPASLPATAATDSVDRPSSTNS